MLDVTADLARVVAALGGDRRFGQDQMAEAVERAFDTGEHLLVQAGTGTGKSLAYLVPAVRHAAAGHRIVITTATLALQRQLLTNDLPAVMTTLTEYDTSFALLKGWQNYVCRHRLDGGYPDEEETLDLEVVAPTPLGRHIQRVRTWALTSDTGDRDELTPGVPDRAWRQVSVSALECLGNRCPFIDECFPNRARAAAHSADIVVTNHAMLAVAATGSPGALPEHDVVVIDEGHELAARVTAQATVTLSGSAVIRAEAAARRAGQPLPELADAGLALTTELGRLPQIRMAEGLPIELALAVERVRDTARAGLRELAAAQADPAALKIAQSALLQMFEVAERIAANEGGRDVIWLSRDGFDGPSTLYAAPLNVAGVIREQLAERATVVTSATLTVGGEFGPLASACGFETGDWRGLDVGSPFDYRRQGVLYVAAHLPRPGPQTPPEQLDEIADLLTAADGGTLGLFSSRRAAERAAEHVREVLDLPILLQGEDSIPNLVAAFAADPTACLFGPLSLWQGIDVPGDTCRLVLIDRIPFPRPDDPVMSARSEMVDAAGGSGFMAVSVTHAAIMLAQGAGRLIRTHGDRGVIAVLDPRLVTARYGRVLLRSLPDFWRTTDRTEVLSVLRRLTGDAV
jgi:ATP-dependent DNA helicase DinG